MTIVSRKRTVATPVVLFAFIAMLCTVKGEAAEDAATRDIETVRAELRDKIELSEIKAEIRRQELRIAQVNYEQQAPVRKYLQQKLVATKQQMKAVAEEVNRLEKLHEQDLVSEQKMDQVLARREGVRQQMTTVEIELATAGRKDAVHDAELRILELKVQMAETRLKHLKRKLEALESQN